MSSTEAPISITVRSPKGTLVTVRGETVFEIETLIANGFTILAEAVGELENAIGVEAKQSITKTITSAFPGAELKSVSGFNGLPPAVDNSFNIPPMSNDRTCPHGKMTALQGPSKNGGTYKGYFCPSAQGDPSKCKTIYIKENSPEWNTFIPDRTK
jgi:hypothetical protein